MTVRAKSVGNTLFYCLVLYTQSSLLSYKIHTCQLADNFIKLYICFRALCSYVVKALIYNANIHLRCIFTIPIKAVSVLF